MPLISMEEDCFLKGRLRRSTVKTNLDTTAGAVLFGFLFLEGLGGFMLSLIPKRNSSHDLGDALQ